MNVGKDRGHGRAIALIAATVIALATVMLRPALLEAASPVDASVLDEAGDREFPEGKQVYRAHCAGCHDLGAGNAPQLTILRYRSPEAIYQALTKGVMRAQAAALSDDQKVQVAQFLSSRKLAATTAAPLKQCTGKVATFDRGEPPVYANWGLDLANSHLMPSDTAGITRANVGRLKLKWSFGFPGAERMRSQPALAGGAIFIGTHTGEVYALDRASGCVRWRFTAPSEVRTGIVVAPWKAGDAAARPLLYFGDIGARVYALEAFTGKPVWQLQADPHPAAVITAAPSLYKDTLYISVSSLEEASASAPGYRCCSFRGSVIAVDAATGARKWQTFTIAAGSPGAGAAVWNSAAIDPQRGQLTIGSTDNYTTPATPMSDSLLALDLASGAIRWHYQALAGDMWNVDCMTMAKANCPADHGPDYGFGAGTMLVRVNEGRELVIGATKGGVVYAVDADSGRPAWQTRVGRGGMAGGVNFGLATAGGVVFAPVSDMDTGVPSPFAPRPGIHALDAATGKQLWYAPVSGDCHGAPGCIAGTSGALSATPELVLAGADDGHVRAYDVRDGKVLWDFATGVSLTSVNGVAAHGGAISGGVTPIAYRGQLFVASGYGFGAKLAGNALLVFSVK